MRVMVAHHPMPLYIGCMGYMMEGDHIPYCERSIANPLVTVKLEMGETIYCLLNELRPAPSG